MFGRYQRPASRIKAKLFRPKQLIGTGRRRLRIVGSAVLLLVLIIHVLSPSRILRNLCYYWDPESKGARTITLGFGPPSYEKLRKWEAELPQHNLDLPYPEGRTGRYVKFSNQIIKLGWNNVFNEVLMNAHLAYESKRAYVFQDYVWKGEYYSWARFEFLDRPPRTPLNAIISGPAAGGPWDAGDDAPRSISERWFEVVCPAKERRIINTRDIKPAIQWSMGDEIFETWRKLLLDAPEPCIEVVAPEEDRDGYVQTFDLYLWGSNRILPLWESFSKSPVSRLLGNSRIVSSAVVRNEYLFFPHGPQLPSVDPYERMLAMHVRRGDYKDACLDLAAWNSTFYSWNLLEFLPDHFEAGPGGGWGWNTPENTEKYLKHCLPSLDAIVQKVKVSKEDYIRAGLGNRTLDALYLLTNDESKWMDQLKDALRQDGWNTIRTSRDLTLDQEQTDVSMAVDMDIARRAAVFIGNGWSSFTSNIVHRRLVDGKEPISIRFY